MTGSLALGLASWFLCACGGGSGDQDTAWTMETETGPGASSGLTGFTTSSTTQGGSTDGGQDGSEGPVCPPGEGGCACEGLTEDCGPGLACEDGVCVPSLCGNAVIEGNEQCDEGWSNDDNGSCKTDCTLPSCGDGFQTEFEDCDDGNKIDHDGCTNACRLPACGDAILHDGEECDDGDVTESGACVTGCALAYCGDGFVQRGVEGCDDANATDTDACRNSCVSATCGDGVIWAGEEQCDGSALGGATCSSLGFAGGGTLACSGSCSYNTGGCQDV